MFYYNKKQNKYYSSLHRSIVIFVHTFVIKLRNKVDLFEFERIFDDGFQLIEKDNIVFGPLDLTKQN